MTDDDAFYLTVITLYTWVGSLTIVTKSKGKLCSTIN